MANTLADRSLPRRLTSQRKKRRGIILLMVVSLLSLFLLMGVTFAILAIQYKTSADSQAQLERYGDPPMAEMEDAMGVLLYDALGLSSLRGHSLLRDFYGTDSVRSSVLNTNVNESNRKSAQNHFVVFSINNATSGTLSSLPGYYNGRVITFITGAARNLSSRIAGYEPNEANSGTKELYIEPLMGQDGYSVSPANGDEFVINGAPFNGMGFGYDPATYRLDAVDDTSTNYPVALLPHYAGYANQQVYSSGGSGTAIAPDVGGADEPWDAADLQNLPLAVVPPGLLASQVTGNANAFNVPLIPSFHRPELVNYWIQSSNWPGGSVQLTQQGHKDLARKIIFRPMPWDHPQFTGSNPDLTAGGTTDAAYLTLIQRMAQQNATGSTPQWDAIWDVDNDGDGVRDSIWVDIGMPAVTDKSGRRYKRLFAFLVKDLDGRINLNVHGNLGQNNFNASTAINYPFPVFGTGATSAINFPLGKTAPGSATANLQLPRGMGFGPAEVDFRYVLNQASLAGQYNTIIQSRYGNDNQPGQANTDDAWSVVKMNGVPANFHMQNSWYGSLPDVWGRNAVAVDFGGRPFFYREQNNASTTETSDDPYEMEWDYQRAVNDTPYTPGDMERLARIHDNYIGGFPQRLPLVSPALFNGAGQPALNNGAYQRLRESLTTMSSSAPTVPGILRYQDRVNMTQTDSSSVLELYRQRLAVNGISGAQQVRAVLAQIMPWEFWQGVPLDLNRYLHNGLDDNSNSANGDPAEALAAAGETAWGTNGSVPSGGNLPTSFSGKRGFHANSIDADADGAQDGVSAATNDRYWGRQLLARHLYCLVLALKDQSYNPPPISGASSNELTTRMIAQWAVNVVDFRDTDGIMTGFEYDVNPFNGWSVDGNLNTTNDGADRRVVWGMEAPDCLLTEVHAMHDRRVKDTKHDPTGKDRDDMVMRDEDLDQFRVPQGSLFLELFCPRMHGTYNRTVSGANEAYYNPHMPFELYDNSGRLDLARTPSGSPYPVWQIAIAKLNKNAQQGLPTAARLQSQNEWQATSYADQPNMAIMGQQSPGLLYDINNPNQTIDIERYIWFTNNDPPALKRNNVFYNRLSWPALLAPGQYMVVGPRQTTYVGSNKTNQGNSVGYWFNNSSQRIDLTQTSVTLADAGTGTNTSKDPTSQIQPVVGMVAMTRPPDTWSPEKQGNQWWVGANITEPLPNSGNYYPEYNAGEVMTWNPVDAYDNTNAPANTLPDLPQDNTRLLGLEGMLQSNIYNNVSAVFLQRLADPTQPWNALSNPYITVDFAPVDATVFSGEEDSNRQVKEVPSDPNNNNMIPIDPDDGPPGNTRIGTNPNRFATGQRGIGKGSLWYPLYTATNLNGNPPTPTNNSRYMQFSLHHTLGYINEAIGSPRDAASSGNYFAYVGDPTNNDKPFPWVTWNNRPFMNAAELLNVPVSAPNRLVMEVGQLPPGIFTPQDPYSAPNANSFRSPFLHLLNMFQSTPSTTTPYVASMNLARLFDYVEVPSNFSHTERWYNPNLIANTDGTPPAMGTLRPEYAPPYLYRPPFNKLSRFRDPGKININTIYDPAIWYALIGYDPTAGGNPLSALRTPANELFQSRQGYNGTVGQMSNAYPTIFANPFRPADTADLMPNVNNMRTRSPAEVGLYRPSSSRSGEPLLGYQSNMTQIDTDRHPYFKHQGLQKLASNVTTQSNCYAVWVTAGYFECEDYPSGIDAAHPDGYQLGQELNVDTSRVQRHRSFFLIDRTIPAGFIPGLKLNTDNCVLLRRQID